MDLENGRILVELLALEGLLVYWGNETTDEY